MTRAARWTLWSLLGLLALTGVLAAAFLALVPSDEELADRLAAQAEEALGVKVTLGALDWQLFPPAVVIENAATVQPQPIRFGRLVARPLPRELLQRRLRFGHVLLEDAVLPQLSLRALRVKPAAPGAERDLAMVEQLRFTNLTWITRHGLPLEFDGDVLFDAGWRPRQRQLRHWLGVAANDFGLARQGDADRWRVQAALGGGTANGQVAIDTGSDGLLKLTGTLEPSNVEVETALAAFKRHSTLRGQAAGRTTLSASGAGVAELARSLHTRTQFTVAGAKLLHIDVDKAIRSFGKDRDGQTALQSLAGQMDTQNTPDGMVVRYSAVQARGDTFGARGEGTIANRQIDGQLTVDIAGGLVGVPLKVKGPLGSPQVTVPGGAVAGAAAGAAVGTAVLPGVGTAIGAGVGAAIGKLFGGDDKKK
ncbi:MAG: hypothetical protein EOO25_02690 [Comamonadaceae bacterium]|nr:MAG: hypothetical protein EOO25_02690 [Comamonadaceae bacterium]